jgi:hypothetical protein
MHESAQDIRGRLGLPNLWEIAEDHGFLAPNGYACEGACLCPDCAGPEAEQDDQYGAIFGAEEVDYPRLCEGCGILIPTALTPEGLAEVRKVDGRTRQGRLYRKAFPWAFRS